MLPKALPPSSGPLSISAAQRWLLYPHRVASPMLGFPQLSKERTASPAPCSGTPRPASPPGKASPPLAARYSRATLHLQGADVVEAALHDVWTG